MLKVNDLINLPLFIVFRQTFEKCRFVFPEEIQWWLRKKILLIAMGSE